MSLFTLFEYLNLLFHLLQGYGLHTNASTQYHVTTCMHDRNPTPYLVVVCYLHGLNIVQCSEETKCVFLWKVPLVFRIGEFSPHFFERTRDYAHCECRAFGASSFLATCCLWSRVCCCLSSRCHWHWSRVCCLGSCT